MNALTQDCGRFLRCVLALPIALAAILGLAGLPTAHAADSIRIVAQKTGTLAWELEIIRNHGLDRQADLNLETTELASTEAGQIALKGGSADLILSDWLWVARERALGDDLVFYPYSSTLGAVMVPDHSPIKHLDDLKGKRLGVAGGPLDKSWLLLQALAQRSGVDLKTQASISYAAPPLLSAMLLQGKTDATLTFWNFCARLEANGMRRAITMADVMKRLGAAGPVPMVGYVFHGGWAERHRALLDRFFSLTQQAKKILASSPAEWQRLGPRIGASNDAELDVYRRRYAEGIPNRPLADDVADAQALYRVLAHIGGPELVGTGQALDPATFYGTGGSE
jgi:NitT/TauT family transport system substrate-binding protein